MSSAPSGRLKIETMNLSRAARQIQYQTAKIEVIELMLLHHGKYEPSLQNKIVCNSIVTLREALFKESEACIDCDPVSQIPLIKSLQNTMICANTFLIEMNSGIDSSELSSLFLKSLLNGIVSSFLNLNTELGSIVTSLQKSHSYREVNKSTKVGEEPLKNLIIRYSGHSEKVERLIDCECQRNPKLNREGAIRAAILNSLQVPKTSISSGTPLDTIKLLWGNLLVKCLGDYNKAERLFQYEKQRNPNLDKLEIIQAAIDRWEKDNR